MLEQTHISICFSSVYDTLKVLHRAMSRRMSRTPELFEKCYLTAGFGAHFGFQIAHWYLLAEMNAPWDWGDFSDFHSAGGPADAYSGDR